MTTKRAVGSTGSHHGEKRGAARAVCRFDTRSLSNQLVHGTTRASRIYCYVFYYQMTVAYVLLSSKLLLKGSLAKNYRLCLSVIPVILLFNERQ